MSSELQEFLQKSGKRNFPGKHTKPATIMIENNWTEIICYLEKKESPWNLSLRYVLFIHFFHPIFIISQFNGRLLFKCASFPQLLRNPRSTIPSMISNLNLLNPKYDNDNIILSLSHLTCFNLATQYCYISISKKYFYLRSFLYSRRGRIRVHQFLFLFC